MHFKDSPWMLYQVHSGLFLPTFIEFQPMNALSEIDNALDRNKKSRMFPAKDPHCRPNSG